MSCYDVIMEVCVSPYSCIYLVFQSTVLDINVYKGLHEPTASKQMKQHSNYKNKQ